MIEDRVILTPLLSALMPVFAAAQLHAETTIYVGKHFEVRDHDTPLKYVFNGGTRVARVTGSLSSNERIQKLRLRAGWNLVSLAVAAPDFLGQWREFTIGPAPVIKAIYRWQPTTRSFGPIASDETVAAGTVHWVSAKMDVVVAVWGTYPETTEWRVPAGGGFVAVPALEARQVTVPLGVTVWRYEARGGHWQLGVTGDLAAVSDLPSVVAPGEAIYVHSNEPTDLGAPVREERIRYYHQDHLGSSSVMTDADGSMIEEKAFYPFGEARNEHRVRQLEEPFGFTQKERDRESGFHYFEARYLAGGLARFITQDPKYSNPDGLSREEAAKFLSSPQEMNLYASTRNNPLKYVDPTGLEVTATTVEDRPGHKATEIKFTGVLLDESSKKLTHEQLKSVQSRIVSQLKGDFAGDGGQQSWNLTVNLRIAKSGADIKRTDHVIRIVDVVPREPDDIPNATTLGQADLIGGKQIRFRADLAGKHRFPTSLGAVVSHEIGHTLGLRHDTDAGNPIRYSVGGRNLMRAVMTTARGTQINVHQIREIQRLYDKGKLNQ